MKCPYCGNEVKENDDICPFCSATLKETNPIIQNEKVNEPETVVVNNNYQTESEPNKVGPVKGDYGVASLVCSICGLFTMRLTLGILGLVFAIKTKKAYGGNSPKIATAGMIISIIDLVLAALTLVVLIVSIMVLLSSASSPIVSSTPMYY